MLILIPKEPITFFKILSSSLRYKEKLIIILKAI